MNSRDYTKNMIDMHGIRPVGLLRLVELFNVKVSGEVGVLDPKGSIMHYGQICRCDDGFLCEHRLQRLIDFFCDNPSGVK